MTAAGSRKSTESPLRYPSSAKCPLRDEHTSAPSGYLSWHAWAERMSRTHRQRRHEPCGFYAVWERRKPAQHHSEETR